MYANSTRSLVLEFGQALGFRRNLLEVWFAGFFSQPYTQGVLNKLHASLVAGNTDFLAHLLKQANAKCN